MSTLDRESPDQSAAMNALVRKFARPKTETHRWRVGSHVPINVYDGDRPVCQCQTAMDARLIVQAVNSILDARESFK